MQREIILIRNAEKRDVPSIVRLHREYISWGFLSSLGGQILNLIYGSLTEFPGGRMIIGINKGEVIGFVIGVTDVPSFYMSFLRKNFLKASRLLITKFMNFSTLRKAMETLFYPLRDSSVLPKAELLAIAVEQCYQGKGVARLLLEELKVQFSNIGIDSFKTSVGAKNWRSYRFFEKMGFRQAGYLEIHKGETSKIYVYDTD